jgi:hypothetical protein
VAAGSLALRGRRSGSAGVRIVGEHASSPKLTLRNTVQLYEKETDGHSYISLAHLPDDDDGALGELVEGRWALDGSQCSASRGWEGLGGALGESGGRVAGLGGIERAGAQQRRCAGAVRRVSRKDDGVMQ